LSDSLRIAVVAACPFPLARGTPVRILRIAEALVDRGHDVHVVTYHLGEGEVTPALKVHRIPDVPSYRKLTPGPTYRKVAVVDPKLTVLLRRLCRELRFDVIHAHHYEGVLVGAAGRVGSTPLVYDAHTLLMSELPFYPLGLPTAVKSGLGRLLDRALPRLADHTVCVTDTIRSRLIAEAGMRPERVSVITNGVEFEHFDPEHASPSLGGPGRIVMFTGNLAEYQGVDHLLRAFAGVSSRIADARLVIASDSSFEPYEALARELGVRERIEVVPSPPFAQLPDLLAAADVAVNPRVGGDGVPVKLLNYMAMARPIVSFDSSAPGMVHRRNGWLIPGSDHDAMAEGILTLLTNEPLARELGAAARQYVAENCRWSIAAERCEALYRTLIRTRA
jgi:glycosyltransferase involved in cell wall biosynthesis